MIELHTLTAGSRPARDTADLVAGFLEHARESVDIAIYDVKLERDVAPITDTIRRLVARDVAVRLVWNEDHARPIPVPPPPDTHRQALAELGADTRAIPGVPDLMHHKYVVRDHADVLTGSTNWTPDSFTREENAIVVVRSPEVAASYSRDFDQLWTTEAVTGTGAFDAPTVTVDGAKVRPWFAPGRGRRISHRISQAAGRATKRVRVCSPVITSGPVLGTLAEIAAAGRVDLSGVYDATQMDEVMGQWRAEGGAAWKIPAFSSLVRAAPFGGKRSTPWGPGTVHDFMHAKLFVADDIVFAGSYNLSHSGEDNAENVLEIESAALADQVVAFVDALRARYPLRSARSSGPAPNR